MIANSNINLTLSAEVVVKMTTGQSIPYSCQWPRRKHPFDTSREYEFWWLPSIGEATTALLKDIIVVFVCDRQ